MQTQLETPQEQPGERGESHQQICTLQGSRPGTPFLLSQEVYVILWTQPSTQAFVSAPWGWKPGDKNTAARYRRSTPPEGLPCWETLNLWEPPRLPLGAWIAHNFGTRSQQEKKKNLVTLVLHPKLRFKFCDFYCLSECGHEQSQHMCGGPRNRALVRSLPRQVFLLAEPSQTLSPTLFSSSMCLNLEPTLCSF